MRSIIATGTERRWVECPGGMIACGRVTAKRYEVRIAKQIELRSLCHTNTLCADECFADQTVRRQSSVSVRHYRFHVRQCGWTDTCPCRTRNDKVDDRSAVASVRTGPVRTAYIHHTNFSRLYLCMKLYGYSDTPRCAHVVT